MGRPRYNPENPTFTGRQRSIVRLIARGLTNDQIAEELGIKPRTAKAHTDTVKAKLRVRSRRELPSKYLAVTGDNPFPTKKEVAQ